MINTAYTIFVELPIFENEQKQLFTDPLWAKDLRLHLAYITHLNLCCPVKKWELLTSSEQQLLENINDIDIKQLFKLRYCNGFLSTFTNFFPNFFIIWQATKNSQIVHSAGAGWPFPSTFYLVLLCPFLRFKWIVNIESSFWMLTKNNRATFRSWLSHYAHKIMLGVALKKADARIFTQPFYQQYFLGSDTNKCLINAASWVDEEKIISIETLLKNQARRSSSPLNLIFPTRLIADKGVHILIDAIEHLMKMKIVVNITIMGSGDLKPLCQQVCNSVHPTVVLKFVEPMAYDAMFFKVLQDYDLIIVANLKEEQPRNIIDAFSQGLGAIASNTEGVMSITNDANTVYYETGNAQALANAIQALSLSRATTNALGVSALSHVQKMTHTNMHEERHVFLEAMLSQ